IFPFCANNLDFSTSGTGSYTRPSGRVFASDYRGSELAGATFHEEWLFFNIQTPGITFAVTGPWQNGAL
ncbi:MAG TPA: phosphatase, partial [Ideonella sp.]|nr:phosphatase [Ideonella sp.]